MNKTLKLAVREYRAAVRTKGFILGLALMPVLMGGSAIGMALLKDQVDTRDRRVAVIDRSGVLAEHLAAATAERNTTEVLDLETGRKVKPAYVLEIIPHDGAAPRVQRLELSRRIETGDLHGFLDIGPDVLHPGEGGGTAAIGYHSRNAAMDEVRQWLSRPINDHLRQQRLADAGVDAAQIPDLFRWVGVEAMGLLSVDDESGEIRDARRSSELEAILVPYVLVLLMFMMFMMAAIPQLGSVTEEKTLRIAEVLLGSMRPFEFMMGKVLGGVGVALTSALVYVVCGIFGVRHLGWNESIPYDALPWFFAFLVLAMFMLGAGFTALGSTCSDTKDSQSMVLPGMLPILVPMFVFMPVIMNPESGFATVMSLIPPFTPMMMVARLATPAAIPAWQPWVGLVGVIIWAFLAVWIGGRIFRVGILMQGKRPRLAELASWIVRG